MGVHVCRVEPCIRLNATLGEASWSSMQILFAVQRLSGPDVCVNYKQNLSSGLGTLRKSAVDEYWEGIFGRYT